MTATARRAALGLALAAWAAGCATARPGSPATLAVRCNVPDAAVFVDDVFVGRASEWAQVHRVRPGFHRIELRDPSHYAHRTQVQLAPGGGAVVQAELRRLLD